MSLIDKNKNSELYLPVSIGEALDKLTILDIKLDRIQDSRRDNVKIEYDILHEKIKGYIDNYQKYYNIMKKTNLYIWNLMDLLRDGVNIDDEEYTKLCKDTIIANDVRFRIKNKINILSNSHIKEQKGYKSLKILIDLSDYTNDNFDLLIKPLYYYSILYDELHVKSSNPILVNFIINEFNNTVNIIDTVNSDIEYLKIYKINNNSDIYYQLDITNTSIDRFL
jgi:hypothetical protein